MNSFQYYTATYTICDRYVYTGWHPNIVILWVGITPSFCTKMCYCSWTRVFSRLAILTPYVRCDVRQENFDLTKSYLYIFKSEYSLFFSTSRSCACKLCINIQMESFLHLSGRMLHLNLFSIKHRSRKLKHTAPPLPTTDDVIFRSKIMQYLRHRLYPNKGMQNAMSLFAVDGVRKRRYNWFWNFLRKESGEEKIYRNNKLSLRYFLI